MCFLHLIIYMFYLQIDITHWFVYYCFETFSHHGCFHIGFFGVILFGLEGRAREAILIGEPKDTLW